MSESSLLQTAWVPSKEFIATTNIYRFMQSLQFDTVRDFHHWTVTHYEDFWKKIISTLGIVFHQDFTQVCDLSKGIENPRWLVNTKLNIIDSCFTADPKAIALIYKNKKRELTRVTYQQLETYVNRIANSLISAGFSVGDAIAIDMPMTYEAVAIYLAIIKMGAVVVSIADSFSSEEIATRLQITQTRCVFTQDWIHRGNKQLPLYEKVAAANPPNIIVIPSDEKRNLPLRKEDCSWQDFLKNNEVFSSHSCDAMTHSNILFSSGTTGQPKAIPWTHTTGIKAASDAYFHQNIQAGDVLAWPTNLGWMMGPWLIFAALINRATLAIYSDLPDRQFGEFIQDAKVTMLGVIPTIVASWRESRCMENLNWNAIKVFSSTGECSNADDMHYLMTLANHKPIIEYCGGTEIGGSYITSTVIQNNYPTLFSTPAMGSNFVLLDEMGKPADLGEVALIPPAIGLSIELLNADSHKVYYENMPTLADGTILRRHGDQAKQLANGYYALIGRVDDTMNLGGIKISAVEIERVIAGIDNIIESAAIAISPENNGPSQLVIFAVTHTPLSREKTREIMQKRINQHLNPLFKIHDIVFTKELPKTASNKIMRRLLRANYQKKP